MTAADAPRRLDKDSRREQLVAAAMPVVAEHGFAQFPLEEVAERANVTRNLLYHYFPRGRPDIAVAVVERAGQQLTEDWVLSESLPLQDVLAANFSRMAMHALKPTDSWRIHRRARVADQPELQEIVDRYTEIVVESVSLNHLGTRVPPPLVHMALTGFLSFGESMLDEARDGRGPIDKVLIVLADVLVATVRAALAASEQR